jgi:hypothetical protein
MMSRTNPGSAPDKASSTRLNAVLGILLLIFAMILSPWTFFALISGAKKGLAAKVFLGVIQLGLIFAAAYILLERRKIRPINYVYVGALLIINACFLIVVDIALALAGFPSVPPLQKIAYPPFFKEVRKSFNEYDYEFSANSQGLRYKEISLAKETPEDKRVLFLGDSYVEGRGVDYDDIFTTVLESYYTSAGQRVSFINGGLSGTAPFRQMQVLFHIGLKYNIDGVVLCIFPNDVIGTPANADFEPRILQTAEPDGLAGAIHFFVPRLYSLVASIAENPPSLQSTRKRDVVKIATREARKRGIPEREIEDWKSRIPRDLLEAANRFEFNGSILTWGLFDPDVWSTCLDIDSDIAKLRWQNLKKCIQFIYDECHKRGIRFALVYIPTGEQYVKEFHEVPRPMAICGVKVEERWLTETSALQEELARWAESAGVPYLDLTEEFRTKYAEHGEKIVYPLDTHWTAVGHRIAADAIRAWLDEEDFLRL